MDENRGSREHYPHLTGTSSKEAQAQLDFFTGPNGHYELTHLIVLEGIGDGKKQFGHFETESDVIRQIAHITNDKNFRIHKLLMINENGESRELSVDFSHGKLRLTLKEEEDATQNRREY